ncbi:Lipoprotein amino terminal region, partial [Operophtera brumata]
NIFLEILPHVRSDACARFIKYLVLEEKLPFNVATHSQSLLEELEVLTKLELDFSADIRHAGILSFATLTHKAMEMSQVKQDYFDGVVVKYFRMYSAEAYTRIIAAGSGRARHERLWATLAGSPNTEEPYMLRILALHMFLSSAGVRETDLLFVHNYIAGCSSKHLQRFWSFYIPFVANQVADPDPQYWATNNYIISGQEEDGAPSLQVSTTGGRWHTLTPGIYYWYIHSTSPSWPTRLLTPTLSTGRPITTSSADRRKTAHPHSRYLLLVYSFYIPFVANQFADPNPQYWATNNYIISGQEEDGAPSLQVANPDPQYWATNNYTLADRRKTAHTHSRYLLLVYSFYIPFVANQVADPDPQYCATNNYIISGQEEDGAPSL